jgi:protein-tyrosine-phosphatase
MPNIEVSSSGIAIVPRTEPYISPIAAILLDRDGLAEYASLDPRQTSTEILSKADLIIFMRDNHHLICQQNYSISTSNYEIWDIPDLDELSYSTPEVLGKHWLEVMRNASNTFESIKTQIEQLIMKLPTYFP